jgi:arabinose-5-phosphate isomerase
MINRKKTRAPAHRSSLITRHSSLETARTVLRTEADAIVSLSARLDSAFDRAVELLAATKGRVIVTGMGKSGLVARKIAATFSSTGTPAFFLHPAEASHGDLGILVAGDTLVALSYSGETEEILRLLDRVKRLGISLISMTGRRDSTLARLSDVFLDVSIEREACSLNLAPTASTTASLALGDALAIALLERKGFREDHFAELHPSGELRKKLVQHVERLMHTGDAVPAVRPDTPLPAVLAEMSRKGFGMANVVDQNRRLMGIITDGDLRRWFERNGGAWSRHTARECMSRNPATIRRREPALSALRLMESLKITSLPVVDDRGRLEGLLHWHDCSGLRRVEPEIRSQNGDLP